MTNLMPLPKARFFDDNGDPLEGGKLYTYAAGTSDLLTTYTDSTGLSANTNPVILDANGEADVWLGTRNYKIVLKDDNDVTLWTVDNVNARSTSSYIDSADYTTLALADAAAVATGKTLVISTQWNTVPSTISANVRMETGGKLNNSNAVTFAGAFEADLSTHFIGGGSIKGLNCYRPEWWGAVADGITDNTQYIQAMNHSFEANGGGCIRYSQGVYNLISLSDSWQALTLNFLSSPNTKPIKVCGDATTIKYSGDATKITFNIAGSIANGFVTGLEVCGITFIGTRVPNDTEISVYTNTSLYLTYVDNANIHDCIFKNNNSTAIGGFVKNTIIHDNKFYDCNGGVQFSYAAGLEVNNNLFKCSYKCDDQIGVFGTVSLPSSNVSFTSNTVDKGYDGLQGVGGTKRGWARCIVVGDYVTDILINGNILKNCNSVNSVDRTANSLGALIVENTSGTIDKLTIINNTIHNCRFGINVFYPVKGLTISKNIISNIEDSPIIAGGVTLLQSSFAKISDNVIDSFGATPGIAPNGIQAKSYDNIDVSGNTITNFKEINGVIFVGTETSYNSSISVSNNSIISSNVPATYIASPVIKLYRNGNSIVSNNIISYRVTNHIAISSASTSAVIECSNNTFDDFTSGNAIIYYSTSPPTTSRGNSQRKYGELWENRNLGVKFPNNTNNPEPAFVRGIYTAPPAAGTWVAGDRVEYQSPAAGAYSGAVCTVGGTPGTWKGYGAVQA